MCNAGSDVKEGRTGRYIVVADKGLYDTVYKSYVVVGTPVYRDYVKSYYYYQQPSEAYYYV